MLVPGSGTPADTPAILGSGCPEHLVTLSKSECRTQRNETDGAGVGTQPEKGWQGEEGRKDRKGTGGDREKRRQGGKEKERGTEKERKRERWGCVVQCSYEKYT